MMSAQSQWYGSHINDSVQYCSNSIANALELLQSCTKPSISTLHKNFFSLPLLYFMLNSQVNPLNDPLLLRSLWPVSGLTTEPPADPQNQPRSHMSGERWQQPFHRSLPQWGACTAGKTPGSANPLTHWPLGDFNSILQLNSIYNFRANFSEWWLRYLLRNGLQMNATRPYWW